MPISASVTNQQITATVGETQIDVSVSGGVGPTGPQGPAGGGYTLPTATGSVLGGVKIGSGISIDGNGVISSDGGYTLPTATGSVLGGVKIGSGVTITDGVISVSTDYAATSHTHGNITNAGAIGSTSGLPVITTTSGVLTVGAFGSSAGTFAEGNDARLSDTRTPTDGTVTTAKLADDAVTYAKVQNVSATDRLLGRSTAGAGDIEEITCTAAGRAILDDADAAAQRTTLSAQKTITSGTAAPTGGVDGDIYLQYTA